MNIEDLISRYIDGELNSEAEADLHHRLAVSPEARAIFRAQIALRGVARDRRVLATPSAALRTSLFERLQREEGMRPITPPPIAPISDTTVADHAGTPHSLPSRRLREEGRDRRRRRALALLLVPILLLGLFMVNEESWFGEKGGSVAVKSPASTNGDRTIVDDGAAGNIARDGLGSSGALSPDGAGSTLSDRAPSTTQSRSLSRPEATASMRELRSPRVRRAAKSVERESEPRDLVAARTNELSVAASTEKDLDASDTESMKALASGKGDGSRSYAEDDHKYGDVAQAERDAADAENVRESLGEGYDAARNRSGAQHMATAITRSDSSDRSVMLEGVIASGPIPADTIGENPRLLAADVVPQPSAPPPPPAKKMAPNERGSGVQQEAPKVVADGISGTTVEDSLATTALRRVEGADNSLDLQQPLSSRLVLGLQENTLVSTTTSDLRPDAQLRIGIDFDDGRHQLYALGGVEGFGRKEINSVEQVTMNGTVITDPAGQLGLVPVTATSTVYEFWGGGGYRYALSSDRTGRFGTVIGAYGGVGSQYIHLGSDVAVVYRGTSWLRMELVPTLRYLQAYGQRSSSSTSLFAPSADYLENRLRVVRLETDHDFRIGLGLGFYFLW